LKSEHSLHFLENQGHRTATKHTGRTLKGCRPPWRAADLSFEAPLKIVEYPDPILRTKNKRIDTFDDNLKKLVDEMFNNFNLSLKGELL
ncbi:hypothetical protein LOK49_LG03G00516, partial [Camellia lanceoleosa]